MVKFSWIASTCLVILLLSAMVVWSQDAKDVPGFLQENRTQWSLGFRLNEALYSPGELGMNHQKRGINCRTCHTPWQTIENGNCRQCHTWAGAKEENIETPSGMKPREIKPERLALHRELSEKPCWDCHLEHRGSTTGMGNGGNHEAYPEELQKECKRCHQVQGEKQHKDLKLEDCSDCHETKTWAVRKFSHLELALNEKDLCEKCHASGDGHKEEMKGFECLACHNHTGGLNHPLERKSR